MFYFDQAYIDGYDKHFKMIGKILYSDIKISDETVLLIKRCGKGSLETLLSIAINNRDMVSMLGDCDFENGLLKDIVSDIMSPIYRVLKIEECVPVEDTIKGDIVFTLHDITYQSLMSDSPTISVCLNLYEVKSAVQ